MKENFRIFSKPRPLFQRVVENQLSIIETIQDNEQKQKAKDDLFNRLSLIHQRSTVRSQQIQIAMRNANLYAAHIDDHVASWEHRRPSASRGLVQLENQPTYGYVIKTMHKLRAPITA